jgi:hypothetical protein
MLGRASAWHPRCQYLDEFSGFGQDSDLDLELDLDLDLADSGILSPYSIVR